MRRKGGRDKVKRGITVILGAEEVGVTSTTEH